MNKDELIKELEELKDSDNYDYNPQMKAGYRTAILDAIDLVKNYFDLADVSKCNCQTPVKCDNCGEMVVKISSGEFCPSCYC